MNTFNWNEKLLKKLEIHMSEFNNKHNETIQQSKIILNQNIDFFIISHDQSRTIEENIQRGECIQSTIDKYVSDSNVLLERIDFEMTLMEEYKSTLNELKQSIQNIQQKVQSNAYNNLREMVKLYQKSFDTNSYQQQQSMGIKTMQLHQNQISMQQNQTNNQVFNHPKQMNQTQQKQMSMNSSTRNNQHQTTQTHKNQHENDSDDYETEEMDTFERQMLNFVNKSQTNHQSHSISTPSKNQTSQNHPLATPQRNQATSSLQSEKSKQSIHKQQLSILQAGDEDNKQLVLERNVHGEEEQFKILERWCNCKMGTTIFDSTKDKWDVENSIFHERVYGKKDLALFIETKTGRRFGCFIPTSINSTDTFVNDNGIFVFCFRDSVGMKFDKVDGANAFMLCSNRSTQLFKIGNLDIIVQKNNTTNSLCYQNKNSSFDYHNVRNALLGRTGGFKPKHIRVFQMIR